MSDSMDAALGSLREQIGNKCRHYNGLVDHTKCSADMTYAWFMDERRVIASLPCLKNNHRSWCCVLASFLSPEEVEKEVAAIEKSFGMLPGESDGVDIQEE